MKYLAAAVLAGFFLLPARVAAETEPAARELDTIDAATVVFEEMPGKLPASVLENAKGIAVIPGELKAGFIFGGELGRGVLVSRLSDGTWSPPALISIAGASFGLQIGGETRNLVLVFNTYRSMGFIENGTLNLGGDVSMAAGPVGTETGVQTGIPEVYAYVSGFGAFLGAVVQGSVVSFDFNANRRLYGIPDPLKKEVSDIPAQARRFSCTVARYTGAPTTACG
jgi:lipid-binding SYLF domain-containing protein